MKKVKIVIYLTKMSGERNRRSLAFRGGGLAVAVGNSCEAPACQERHLNGNRADQEEDLGAKGPSLGKAEGGGSVSDSTEPEEDDDPEGGSWTAEKGVKTERSNGGCGWANGVNREDGGARKPLVEMRPQTLLQKHSLFQASWLQEFPWLKFCQETGLMSCSWCHNIAANNSDELVKGSRNYKRALLLRHHLSSEHGRNDPTKQVRSHPTGRPTEPKRLVLIRSKWCHPLEGCECIFKPFSELTGLLAGLPQVGDSRLACVLTHLALSVGGISFVSKTLFDLDY